MDAHSRFWSLNFLTPVTDVSTRVHVVTPLEPLTNATSCSSAATGLRCELIEIRTCKYLSLQWCHNANNPTHTAWNQEGLNFWREWTMLLSTYMISQEHATLQDNSYTTNNMHGYSRWQYCHLSSSHIVESGNDRRRQSKSTLAHPRADTSTPCLLHTFGSQYPHVYSTFP